MSDDEIRALAERLFETELSTRVHNDTPQGIAMCARKAILKANLFAHKWADVDRHKWGVEEYRGWLRANVRRGEEETP